MQLRPSYNSQPKRTRDEQAKRAANQVYRASRRPRRPFIYQRELELQRTRADGTPVRAHSSTVLHWPARPLTRAAARLIGRGYARVLNGRGPIHVSAKDLAEEKADNNKAAEARQIRAKHGQVARFKRPAKGLWWASRFADVVERRADRAVPKYAADKVRARKRAARARKRRS
jgi:hypothetical protein